ncbi:MAG: TIR domain-containing protein [Desulfarculus sp.]|nr:TIR domain-containing protein [Desulfarculus sp.]
MADEFKYDVFISYSSKDKKVVHEVAERLRADGLRVWLDAWEIKAGDSIPAKIEEGLEHSRVLVLCMSAEAFGADWVRLESGTFRFRDPLNRERRFIPLRLDEAPIKGSLAQFLYISWLPGDREQAYGKLVEACRPPAGPQPGEALDVYQAGEAQAEPSPPGSAGRARKLLAKGGTRRAGSPGPKAHPASPPLCLHTLAGHSSWVRAVSLTRDGNRAVSASNDRTLKVWDLQKAICLTTLEGHSGEVWAVSLTRDGQRAVSVSGDKTLRVWDVERGKCLHTLEGHSGDVRAVSLTLDGQRAVSASSDKTLRVWDVERGRCLHTLEGHTRWVSAVSLTRDGQRAVSVSGDKTLRVWDVEQGKCLHTLEGHSGEVLAVSLTLDGQRAVSASFDDTLRVWDLARGKCLHTLEGHSGYVRAVSLTRDGQRAVSASFDHTLRVWDLERGKCLHTLEGHSGDVYAVSLTPDGQRAVSASRDGTLRVWDLERGKCLHTLEGHSNWVRAVSLTPDGQRAVSASWDNTLRVWDLSGIGSAAGEAGAPPSTPAQEQVQYTNAKVLLVGETSAGKTGLSMRLARKKWEPSDSTVGAWATQWKLPVAPGNGLEREIWLWDFGGQADQRLIHQLYMDETALAVLVFDGQKDDIFETLGIWDRDLQRASHQKFSKLLAAGRVDAGGLRAASRGQIEAFAQERGYARFLETSAKENIGCDDLKQAIIEGIPWDEITKRSSPLLFKRLKEEIVRLKDQGRVLMRFNELRETLQLRLLDEGRRFNDAELKTVISLLAGPGVVWELGFGGWVLLQPEVINAYAQAVIRTIRQDEHERGCLPEERVLRGELDYHASMERLPEDDERIVLLAMHRTLVARGLCLRENTRQGAMLVFPSYYRRERPDLGDHPAVLVSYRFSGFMDEIYATLVVRMHYAGPFQQDQLWRYAADFKTLTGKPMGVMLSRKFEGSGELEVYFDPAIPVGEKMIFSKYVHEHLLRHAKDVVRLRHYVCQQCGTPVGNRDVAMRKLAEGKKSIICADCEKRVPLWDEMEELFASEETRRQVLDLEKRSQAGLDSESKERVLVGEVISTVALAGQLCREFSVSDHGIDMEIEFKTDAGQATGRKVYLQLKSGDSYVRARKSDGTEVFDIKDDRHATYWREQAFPVMLVIRNSKGEIRWMEVRDWLKAASDNGKKTVRQIVFEGKRFDVMAVRRWRDEALG